MGQPLSALKSYPIAASHHESNNILAQKLFDVVGKDHVFSPLSISYIMSLLHLASAGNTETQITNLMSRKNTLEDLFLWSKTFNSDIIKLANAILVNKNKPVKDEYLEMVSKLALVSNEDFTDTDAIVEKANSFIKENTNGLIKDILKPSMIDMDTVMVLINTIYFKTEWERPFRERNTHLAKFNKILDVDMMCNTSYFSYYEDSNVQMVELMYKEREYCMGIILPKEFVSIDSCVDYLGKNIPFEREYVKVSMPKFTQRRNIDLIPHMKKLGVTNMFDSTSQLDNMCIDTYVSTMIHEAVVIVDEVGTEASAVTVAVCQSKSIRNDPEPKIFQADHSFIYYIKHIPTKTLLFVGDFHGQ